MTVILPREELRKYVRYYWMLESDKPFSILTFPIGCPQIIFHRGTPLYIPEINTAQSEFTVSGQVNFPAHICSEGNLDMIVAVFYPHTIGMFIDTPPSAFYNLEISGYDLENIYLNETAKMVFDCNSNQGCVEILENRLLARLKTDVNFERIGHSIFKMFEAPDTPVSTLADIACLGIRQFGRVFQENVGMNPKEYSRIVRFQKAMWLMQQGRDNYAAIAAECGFSDQSHFIREFKSMSGHTPHSLKQYCEPYSDLFADPPFYVG